MANSDADTAVGLDSIESIGDYLSLFGSDLIRRLNDEYKPVHHPGTDESLSVLSQLKRPLFNAQAHVTTALFKGFLKQRRQILVGEMGVGKSGMSVAVLFAIACELLGGHGRVIYMVPNHLTKKTKREIELLLPKSTFEITYLQSYKDVLLLRKNEKFQKKAQKIEVYIIARDTVKLGYIYEPAVHWEQRSYISHKEDGRKKIIFDGWKCPDCGCQLMREEKDSMVPMEHEDFFNKQGKPTRRKYNLRCSNRMRLYKHNDPEQDEYRVCGASLWQAKNKNKSSYKGLSRAVGNAPRRVSPADLFKRYFKNKFDLAIGDECHELTGGTAQAHAFHVLMGCAKYVLAMTGSLSNGYASNLFELFFRMFPKRLKDHGFVWGEVSRWIDLYGVRERITKTKLDSGELNSSSNGSSKKVSFKELPAAAPQLFTDMLSDVAVFIQMSDIFEVLPKLKEGPMFVPLEGNRKFISTSTQIVKGTGRKKRSLKKWSRLMAPAWYLKRNLREVEGLLRAAVEKELQGGGQSVLLGSLVNTLLSYPDLPFNFKGVYHPDTKREIVSPRFKLSERVLYPKELNLIKYVRARIKTGRKVAIFATFTGKMGMLQRLQQLLEERGIKTAVLESSVIGSEREEWIAQKEREGIQVLLCNPILVSTGLDLLSFSSLYFYQTGYRLTIVRQAGRRHWRIGQKNLCETVYSGYIDSMQELAINLMAAKMRASMALEGQFSDEGLAALSESSGGSLANELAKRFVGKNIGGVESAESIWGKMTIDASELIQQSVPNNILANEDTKIYVTTYTDKTMDEVISSWIRDVVPEDLSGRFQQQLRYVSENVEKGVIGLTLSYDLFLNLYELVWDSNLVPSEERAFRRWLFTLTNKQVQSDTTWLDEVHVISSENLRKTKKSHRVTEGQIAFNF